METPSRVGRSGEYAGDGDNRDGRIAEDSSFIPLTLLRRLQGLTLRELSMYLIHDARKSYGMFDHMP